uniref:Uncharacterized protein n=1 Tax=Cannabis sativa TaxID=3483 RepID=A0A803QVJ2_CANSA
MASVSQLNQFPCKTCSVVPPRQQSKLSVPPNSIGVPSRFSEGPKLSTRQFGKARPVFRVRVADDDEWGPEPVGERSAVAVAEEEAPVEPSETANLKKALVDSFYGTNRGLRPRVKLGPRLLNLLPSWRPRIRPRLRPKPCLSLTGNGFLHIHLSQVY